MDSQGESSVVVSPPGTFVKQDLYLHKRWRRVQYLANIFWKRWRQEYLNSINKQQKWTGEQRNISIGDVVPLCDENEERNEWKLARVVECFTSNYGLERSVKIQLATNELDRNGRRMNKPTFCTRPIHKLILLIEA